MQILMEIPFGIVIADAEGIIQNTNEKFRKLFFEANNPLEGQHLDSLFTVSSKQKFADFLSDLRNEDLSENQLSNQLFEIADDQKKQWPMELGVFYSEEFDKQLLIGILESQTYSLDHREKLKKQVELKNKLKDELEQETELNDMKSRFLSIASHEFRTPLAGILSSLNLINRYLTADEQNWNKHKNKAKISNHLKKIDESVKNLTAILNKFLSLGNIEKGEIPVKFVKIDLVKVLKDHATQFQNLTKKGQTIHYQHQGKPGPIFQDRYLLKNILNNLLSNAIKFSPENSEIYLKSIFSGDEIKIEIRDKGIGIPVADQKRIFRRFFRAKNALSYQEGTGLGLNIVKQYVELMGGTIEFESEENNGTTFEINLPNQIK